MNRFSLTLHIPSVGRSPGRKLHRRRVENTNKEPVPAPAANPKSTNFAKLKSSLGLHAGTRPDHRQPGLSRRHNPASSHSIISFKAMRYPQNTIIYPPRIPDGDGNITRDTSGEVVGPCPMISELSPLSKDGLHRSGAISVRPRRSKGRLLSADDNHHTRSHSKLYRQAKTPVHATGQLERPSVVVAKPLPLPPSSRAQSSATTVDSFPGSNANRHESHWGDACLHKYHQLRHKAPLLAFHSARSSPLTHANKTSGEQEAQNLGLQICLELLAEELSAGTLRLQQRADAGVPELELWLMIEAYEKLRDQLLERRPRDREELEELAVVRTMFDIWVRALHKVYQDMRLLARRSAVVSEVGVEDAGRDGRIKLNS